MNKYTVINPHEPFRVLNTHVHNIDAYCQGYGSGDLYLRRKAAWHALWKNPPEPHPHAKIIKIDASKALALPGVMAVVNGKDDTLGIKQ